MRKLIVIALLITAPLFFNGTCLGQNPSAGDGRPAPSNTLGESAKEALRALKKLEARVTSGISYRDYGPAIGDARFEVDLFLDSPEAKNKPELAKAIANAMSHFGTAKSAWGLKFSNPDDQFLKIGAIRKSSSWYSFFLNAYPMADKDASTGGALLSEQGNTYLHIDFLIPIIWAEASKQVKKATELYSQQ